MSANTGSHFVSRHGGGAAGGGVTTRDTHGPIGFSPAIVGVSYADVRSGEQSQLPDIAPEAIDGSVHILPQSLSLDLFAEEIRPPTVVDALPSLPDDVYPQGALVFLTTDEKLYRNTDGSTWSVAIDAVDLEGEITTTQIANDAISTPKLQALSVTTAKIAAGAVEADKIAANSITAGQIAAGAIATDELAAGAITTEKFHVGARAPGVENSTAEVLIDEDGLTILNGQISIADYSGESVLTAAGFAGSWTDFIASGTYNGLFRAPIDITNSTAVTLVSAGEGADYSPSLSTDLPYWIVEAVTGTGRYSVTTDAVFGRCLRVSKSGAGVGAVRISADAPVVEGIGTRIELEVPVAFEKGEVAQADSIEIYLTELDANHEQVSGEMDFFLWATIDDEATTSEVNKIYVDRMNLDPDTRFLRVHIQFNMGSTASTHTGTQSLYGLYVRSSPLVIPEVYVREGVTFLTEGFQHNFASGALTASTDKTVLEWTTSGLSAGIAQFGSAMLAMRRGNHGEPGVLIGMDASDGALIEFSDGTNPADLRLARRTAGDLKLVEAEDGTGSPLFRIQGDTGTLGLIIEDPDDTTSRLLLGTNTGTPRLEFGSGTAARDVVVTRLTNPGIRFEVDGASEFEIVTGGRFILPNGGYFEMVERTAPAAPAANRGRLFLRDNGAGKTQLCIIFSSGAIQVIATQP